MFLISILEHKIKFVYVCIFVYVCVDACEIDLTGRIFMVFYMDMPIALCGITAMHFIYKFTVAHFLYGLREHYYYSITVFIISMRYWGLLLY
jgi:hypothetical protein